MALWLLPVCLGFLALLVWKWFNDQKPDVSHIPCPDAIPVIGNMPRVGSHLHLTLAEWAKQHGGVLRLKFLNRDTVVVNSYEAIREVLLKKGNDFAGRPQRRSFQSKYLGTGIAFGNPDEAWHAIRKCCHQNLKMFDSGMKHIEKLNYAVISDLAQDINQKEGKPFNPWQVSMHAVTNIITLLCASKKHELGDPELKKLALLEEMAVKSADPRSSFLLNTLPIVRYLGNETFKNLKAFAGLRRDMYESMKKHVIENANSESGSTANSVFHALLRMHKDNVLGENPTSRPDPKMAVTVDDSEMVQIFGGLMIAGFATTVRIFYAYFNILSQHPEVQKRLQEEADRFEDPEHIPSYKDRSELPYSHATLLELLRYTSVTPLALPHCTIRDTSVQGMKIPRNTDVLVNTWAMHHDEQVWDKPYEFCPERFLDETGQVVDASHKYRRNVMAFGAGPRVCLGEAMAINRLFVIIEVIAKHFDVKPGPVKVSCDARDYLPGLVATQPEYEVSFVARSKGLPNISS